MDDSELCERFFFLWPVIIEKKLYGSNQLKIAWRFNTKGNFQVSQKHTLLMESSESSVQHLRQSDIISASKIHRNSERLKLHHS